MADEGKRERRKSRAATEGSPPRPPTVLVAFRVPPAVADRLDRLAAELSTAWHDVKRSELARAALERGLDALEQEAAARRGDGGS